MRKNILLFGHSYGPQFVDISNQYTKLFDPKKYKVTVAYLVGEPNETIRNKHFADEVLFLNYSRSSVRGLKLFPILKMLELQRQNKFHLVVCHRYKPTYIMLWVARFTRIPLLFSIMHELGTLKHITRKLLIATLAKKNTLFAGVSDAVRNDMQEHIWRIPPSRVITLHNMIDIDSTEPQLLSREQARAELHLSPDAFVFGNIARLAKNKDQKTLIKAFANIVKNSPPAKEIKLIIIGDGILEQELKTLVRDLGLEKDVIFTGFIADGFRFMKAFDVYISSSTQEAFGRVLLEAMVAQVPVIATRVNGVPEVVGSAGVLINAADPHQLSHSMLTALQNMPSELIRWGKQGYERAHKHFSLKRFQEIFWQLPIIQNKDLI